MKRDWELVRQILLRMEEAETPASHLHPTDVEGYDAENVSYHLKLMDEAGLITARCTPAASKLHCIGLSLTWEGHELLDKVRTLTMWNRIKGIVREKGLDLSFEVIKAAAKTLISSLLS